MAGGDEHFRRPTRQEELTESLDDNSTTPPAEARVRVSYVVEQDEDGFWCARAQVRQGVAAFGDGLTREAALDDLRAGLAALLSVAGPQS